MSALLKFLSTHPQVSFGGTGTFLSPTANFKDAANYYQLFGVDSGKTQILLERNPRLYLTPKVVDLILKINKNVKIVFVGKIQKKI